MTAVKSNANDGTANKKENTKEFIDISNCSKLRRGEERLKELKKAKK